VDSRPPRLSRPNLADLAAKARASKILGTVISKRYRIIELLAMGGVGAVYLAEHVHMHKHVAVKLLHPDSQGLPDLVPRFEREAVAGAHIQHPNVAAATDFGELEDGSYFLVLEYVRGTTLREVIRRGPLTAARAVRIGRQIAAALGAAHAMGIVHRDVKPRNVMLLEGERDRVKLIDFGLAKLDLKQVSAVAASHLGPADERITTSGAVFGTIAYLAPEAALGMDTVDARADLYALGIVLYEMLAGTHPFDTTEPVELFRRHNKVRPPPIAARSPGIFVPPSLEAVVMRLLEKAPEARYESAEALIAALDTLDVTSPTIPPMSLGEATPIFPGPSIAPASSSNSGLSELPSSSSPAGGSPLPALFPHSSSFPPPPPRALGPRSAPASSPAPDAGPESSTTMRPALRRAWPYAAVAAAALVLTLAGGWAIFLSERRDGPSTTESAAPTAPAAPARSALPDPASAPSPAASSSVAAPAPAGPQHVDLAARTILRSAAAGHDWPHATDAFLALVDHDVAAFHDPLVVVAARDVAAAAGVTGGDVADRVFEALELRLGTGGLDILYEIVRTRGGSKAAARAQSLLDRADVMARATPELRITFALREAPCADKPALLARAAAEGDGRTLLVMQTLGVACLGKSQALGDAQRALAQRLRGQ
jgi:serine/threonine-protein kinase